jgi:hypothetical protein
MTTRFAVGAPRTGNSSAAWIATGLHGRSTPPPSSRRQHSNARSSFYEHEIGVSMVINHHYARLKERYCDTRGHGLTDEQRHSTYDRVERAVIASIADPRSDLVHDIAIEGADPPWTARLPAPAIRNYHRMTVEALANMTL